MTFHNIIFATHVTAAIAALLLGGIAIVVPKSRGYHTKAGEAYFWILLYAMLAAFYLAAKKESPFLIFLPPVAIYTAIQGYLATKTRKLNPIGWKKRHLKYVTASYIACWTAVAVLEFPGPPIFNFLWPTFVGVFLIRRYMNKHAIA